MNSYTAIVTKEDGEKAVFASEYNTKSNFIQDIRANGWKVSNAWLTETYKYNGAFDRDEWLNDTEYKKVKSGRMTHNEALNRRVGL